MPISGWINFKDSDLKIGLLNYLQISSSRKFDGNSIIFDQRDYYCNFHLDFNLISDVPQESKKNLFLFFNTLQV